MSTLKVVAPPCSLHFCEKKENPHVLKTRPMPEVAAPRCPPQLRPLYAQSLVWLVADFLMLVGTLTPWAESADGVECALTVFRACSWCSGCF